MHPANFRGPRVIKRREQPATGAKQIAEQLRATARALEIIAARIDPEAAENPPAPEDETRLRE